MSPALWMLTRKRLLISSSDHELPNRLMQAAHPPPPGAQRTRVDTNTEEALFRDLFDVTSTPAWAIGCEQARIDLLNDQSTSATRTNEQLSKQLADLQSRQGKSRRHELGVLDVAARQVLTRSVRAPKTGDLLYAIVPSPTGRYELKHSKVANVEGEYVYFTQHQQIVDGDSMDDDDDLIVVDKHVVFRDETRANQALVALNDLLN